MALLAHDDVVVDDDAKILGGLDDLHGHFDIGARRRWIARRMIVHEHDRRCRQLKRPLHDLPHIDLGMIDRTFLLTSSAMIWLRLSRKRMRNCSLGSNPIEARQ